MNSFVKNLAQLFSTSPKELISESEEDVDTLTIYYEIDCIDKQLPENLNVNGLNTRDILTIGLFDGIDEYSTEQRVFSTNQMEGWGSFSQFFNNMDKDDPVKIKFTISKNFRQGKYSVYCPDLFVAYLKNLAFLDIITLFNDVCKEQTVCFEFQEGNVFLVGPSLAFVSLGHNPIFPHKPTLNSNVVSQGKYLCCNDLIREHLLPTDFDLHGTDNQEYPLLPLFYKAAMLYSLCFIFDYVSLSNNSFEYKLNGYKTLSGCLNVETMGSAKLDVNSYAKYLDVFKWNYNGGNLTDKSAIARNIISLNIIDEDKLSLRDGVLDAIDSNYKIYEKENVRQYIDLRNNVFCQLRDYQKHIIGIFDDFESDYKKLLFSFLTFAFTTALIRVMAKGISEYILIPDTIILILLAFCASSLLYYAFVRWERDEKVKLFDKQYNDTRKFFEGLLSEKEMLELFTDERNEDGTYKAFVKERTYMFDWLWIGQNVVFIVLLLIIKFYINETS